MEGRQMSPNFGVTEVEGKLGPGLRARQISAQKGVKNIVEPVIRPPNFFWVSVANFCDLLCVQP